MVMDPYVVRKGEHLLGLATRMGFEATSVWEAPENERLRAQRNSMHILAPGDVLFVPKARPKKWLPVTMGSVNRFVATVPTMPVTVRFLWSGRPLPGAACTVRELPRLRGLATGADGVLTLQVPATTVAITLDFASPAISAGLWLGHLDPLRTPSGLAQRLQNLGYMRRDGAPDAATLAVALRGFQRARGLSPTGISDGDTWTHLSDAHGC